MIYTITGKNRIKLEVVTEHRVIQTHTRLSADPYFSYLVNIDVLGTYSRGSFPSEQAALRAVSLSMKEYLKEGYEKTGKLLLTKSGDGDDVLSEEMRFNIEEVMVSKKKL